MRRFRFGTNMLADEPGDWADVCRAVEAQGFDVLLAPDHLGMASPFVRLAAAAAVTSRLRLGTYVLNNEFWNPALLAREAATLDQVSGGRFELGLGSGHMKSEFDDAGILWRPHAERTANLVAALDELDRRLAEGGQEPRPVQSPRPPLLIGGHGPATLTMAAERADIVGFSGLTQRRRRRLGEFSVADSAETLRRVELVRERAAGRGYESSVLVQMVAVTDDVEATTARILEQAGPGVFPEGEPVWENPYVLIGTPREIADRILERRERYGFSYVVTQAPYRDALAEAIPLVRAQEGTA
ncbi:TIGR03621 family F420-dependent LLM class oxidoreductase [Nocardiopsis alborubida]|uniref:TIGR03621 family F420-dependent LLM class oxidoreductase n=1 Tax=Nocardiopsis alborubida TaxID=146802 RepID=A0A7X6ME17_9ACTN|nr:TIGR03621 family F420-dependent LLM class oxidoreductase [Nocardiopsis alborubida]NKY99798.1 TIGR03621 family F420-dependent LLM class oxidoreductase [Nocardiopsis alborubida]